MRRLADLAWAVLVLPVAVVACVILASAEEDA